MKPKIHLLEKICNWKRTKSRRIQDKKDNGVIITNGALLL